MAMSPRLLRPLASGYRYASLRKGLVAYWPLNETATSGDVLAGDETGRGNHLGSSGSVLSATGKVGNGREFVAANSEYLFRDSNTDLQFGDGDWSIAAWVYVTATGSASGRVVGKDQAGGRDFELLASTNTSTTSNKFTAVVYHTDGTFVSVAGPGETNANFINVWRHVVVTNTSGVISLYLNGAAATGSGSTPTATKAAGKTFAATATPLNIGRRSFSGFPDHFDGIVDELAKWNRALSAAEISTLYNNGNGIDLSAPRKTFAPFPGVSNAETLDWINAVYAAGSSVNTATAKAVDEFVSGCKADGIWSAIKACCVLCGPNTLAGALVPLVGTAPTNNNFVAGDYDRKTGLVGNASTKYLDTNRANDADPQNSNHNAVYVSQAGTDGVLIGSGFSVNENALFWSGASRNRSSTVVLPLASVARAGVVGMSRSGSSAYDIRYDGATVGSGLSNSATPDANNLFIFRRNNASAGYYDGRIAFYSIGEALDLEDLDTRVSALITAIGAS